MELYDQHLHSCYSFDSESAPAQNVEAALSRGLAGLTFTEHFDTHPDDWKDCRYDDEAYSAAIEGLQGAYGSRIFIGKGIEVCYQPDTMDDVLDFLAGRAFDLVILSVHYFRGRPVHVRDHWAGLDVAEGTRWYLETVLEAVRFCEQLHHRKMRVFDVLGHLDLVKRYTHRFFDRDDVSGWSELLDEILRGCLGADLIPEVNTSTLRRGLGEPMPGADTIARYAALGGTAMLVGSDAHETRHVGAGLEEALGMLRTAGVKSVGVFKNRSRTDVPIV